MKLKIFFSLLACFILSISLVEAQKTKVNTKANKDEKFDNLYYVGASTVPGTGLPIVVISSRLVTERILKDDGAL